MKPEQFIREQGLEAIKDCIEEAEAYGGLYVNAKTLELSEHIPSYDAVSITELMRLVESLEILDKSGGYEAVKAAISNYRASGDMVTFSSLEKRLEDHESIYGGGDV